MARSFKQTKKLVKMGQVNVKSCGLEITITSNKADYGVHGSPEWQETEVQTKGSKEQLIQFLEEVVGVELLESEKRDEAGKIEDNHIEEIAAWGEEMYNDIQAEKAQKKTTVMSGKKKVLYLTLNKKPFQVTKSGEKKREFRKPTDWIKSRLMHKDGTNKEFTHILYRNGYRLTNPSVEVLFEGWEYAKEGEVIQYSNGLEVVVEVGDIIIHSKGV